MKQLNRADGATTTTTPETKKPKQTTNFWVGLTVCLLVIGVPVYWFYFRKKK